MFPICLARAVVHKHKASGLVDCVKERVPIEHRQHKNLQRIGYEYPT